MNKEKRFEIMKRLAAERPNPVSELEYRTPYELLVAVVLSAQATDKSVNLATRKLYPVANTPKAILALGVEGLIPYIKTIGLYRNKAKHVIELSRKLLEDFDGVFARRRPQNSQRGFKRGLWQTHHRGGYTHLSREQPHRFCPWQNGRRGRAQTLEIYACGI